MNKTLLFTCIVNPTIHFYFDFRIANTCIPISFNKLQILIIFILFLFAIFFIILIFFSFYHANVSF